MIVVYALSAEMQNAGSCTNRYSCGQLPIFERRARAAPHGRHTNPNPLSHATTKRWLTANPHSLVLRDCRLERCRRVANSVSANTALKRPGSLKP
jgi:hypothetical protein